MGMIALGGCKQVARGGGEIALGALSTGIHQAQVVVGRGAAAPCRGLKQGARLLEASGGVVGQRLRDGSLVIGGDGRGADYE